MHTHDNYIDYYMAIEGKIFQLGKGGELIYSPPMTFKEVMGPVGTTVHSKFKPIKSYGVILYMIDKNKKIKFLLAQSRDTFAYIDFIKSNIDSNRIIDYINMMTTDEKNRIINNSRNFTFLWKKLWTNSNSPFFISRFKECFTQFLINLHNYGHHLLATKDKGINSTSWLFPKGRQHTKTEPPMKCAKREFEEETGIDSNTIEIEDDFKQNNIYQESYLGTDNKFYQAFYYVAKYKYDVPPVKNYILEPCTLQPIISDEVKETKWVELEEALLLLEDDRKRKMLWALHNRLTNE